jgi:HEAT repeat protein
MPTEQEAARLVQTMLDLPRDRMPSMGERREDFPDLSVLRHQLYIPMLRKQAASVASGRPEAREALEALARMPDPAAATVLARMTDEAAGDAKAKFASALAEHLPHTSNEFGGATTAPAAAAAGPAAREAAAEARRLATPMLVSDNDDQIRNGAVLLLRAGTSDDMPLIVKTLDRLIPRTVDEPRSDDIFSQTRSTIFSLRHAARELMTRGAARPADPKSPGEILLWLTRDSAATQPSQWAVPGAEKWLDHPIPFIRQSALEAMPTTPFPPATRDRLVELIEDPDINVRMAAAGVAHTAKQHASVPALLRRLARADSKWEIDAVAYALEQLGASVDAWKVIARRLDEAKLIQTFFGRLSAVIKGFNGWGWNGNVPVDPPPHALKKKWTAWLNEHEVELRAGKRFAPGDAALPTDLFPKNFSVDTPQGGWPPHRD